MGTNKLYGYITLDTLDSLGQPRDFNELSFVVAENRLDETHIRQVAGQVTDKLEKSRRTVYATVVPTPGENPMQKLISAMLFILSTLGTGFLVATMISALMAQQIKQIGLMKATNNGAERAARAFRHRQAPHFNLRSKEAIARAMTVTACLRKEAVTKPAAPPLHTCQRGRKKRAIQPIGFDDRT